MYENQLFRHKPPNELILKILHCFNLQSLDDKTSFTQDMIEQYDTVGKINALSQELVMYYIPCKARTYLTNLNKKNVITILRHFIKLHHYTVLSAEKWVKGIKKIIYSLHKKNVDAIVDKSIISIQTESNIIDFS